MRSAITMLLLLCVGLVSFVVGQVVVEDATKDPLKSGAGASRNISIA
jgi:hypothetical protein